MEIQTRKESKTTIISVKGRIDAVTAPRLEKNLFDLIAQGETALLLNLQELDYISSAGLRSILSAAKQLKAKSGELFIAGLQGSVRDVFQMSGFYTIFRIFELVEEALQAE
jgi:anti-anti-sigma factor